MKHKMSPQIFEFSPELNSVSMNQELTSKVDIDYGPSKTDFSKITFLDAEFNQIIFKNGMQLQDGWARIDPSQRNNYRVIIRCESSQSKQKALLEQNVANPSLKY